MDIVLPMLQQARDYLSDEGILVVEVGYSQPALEKILPQLPFFWVEFEFGGDGVFVLTAEQLDSYQADFELCAECLTGLIACLHKIYIIISIFGVLIFSF